jgi:hypothetical protein
MQSTVAGIGDEMNRISGLRDPQLAISLEASRQAMTRLNTRHGTHEAAFFPSMTRCPEVKSCKAPRLACMTFSHFTRSGTHQNVDENDRSMINACTGIRAC